MHALGQVCGARLILAGGRCLDGSRPQADLALSPSSWSLFSSSSLAIVLVVLPAVGGFVLDCLKAAQSVFIFHCLKAAQSVMSFLDASIQGNPCCHRWSHKKSIIYSVTLEWLKQHILSCHLWMIQSSIIHSVTFECLDPAQTVPSHLDVSAQNNPFRRLWAPQSRTIHSATFELLKPTHSVLSFSNGSNQRNLVCHLWMAQSNTIHSVTFECLNPAQSSLLHLITSLRSK